MAKTEQTEIKKNTAQQLYAPGMNADLLGTRFNARKQQTINLEQMGAAGLKSVYLYTVRVYRKNTDSRFHYTYLTLREYCTFNTHTLLICGCCERPVGNRCVLFCHSRKIPKNTTE